MILPIRASKRTLTTINHALAPRFSVENGSSAVRRAAVFQVKTCIQRDGTGLRSKSRGRSRPAMVGRTDNTRRARAARSPGGGAAACQRRCSACLAMGYVRGSDGAPLSAKALSPTRVRPALEPAASRKGRSRSAREAWWHPPAEDQRGATITGARVDPAGAAAIRRALRARVPSAEAHPVSAP